MRAWLIAASLAAVAAPAAAQEHDHHAGHAPPTQEADPHAGHVMPAEPADPHAGHVMPPAPADPHAGHVMPSQSADPHAGHRMAPETAIGAAPPPPVPSDHAAERFFPADRMAAARAQLRREHGAMAWSKVMLETAEARGDGYAWEGSAAFGGDVNRFVVATEGEGEDRLHAAEVQALYSRAIGPYFNLQAGVRQDLQRGPRRTYATLGVEGVAPYWFEVAGAVFLSDDGELSARMEASYDLRLTQRLILEPRAELNLEDGDAHAELGLRLRFAVTPEFAPYAGVHHGEDDTRLVLGLRAWF